jgi:hypothetical protein
MSAGPAVMRGEDLSEHPAEGEAEEVDPLQPEACYECLGIRRHPFHGIRGPAG